MEDLRHRMLNAGAPDEADRHGERPGERVIDG